MNDELWSSLRHRSLLAMRESIKAQVFELGETNEVAQYIKKEKSGEQTGNQLKLVEQLWEKVDAESLKAVGSNSYSACWTRI